jgi:kinesin family protein 6/9
MLNQNGDVIIEEGEYLEIQRLQDLKKSYQNDFDELRKQRSEVQYCQRLAEQCRQRLIQGLCSLAVDKGAVLCGE